MIAVKLFGSSKSRGSIGIGKLPSDPSDSQSTASVMVYAFSRFSVVLHCRDPVSFRDMKNCSGVEALLIARVMTHPSAGVRVANVHVMRILVS